jgi:hypothetical protein
MCADAGFTLPQIKAVTGHKSDTVVQSYIDNSKRQKLAAALAVSTDRLLPAEERENFAMNSSSSSAASVPPRVISASAPSGAVFHINLTGCTVAGSLFDGFGKM